MKNAGPSSADPVFCDRRRDAARGGRRKESLEKRTQRAGAAVFSGGGGFRRTGGQHSPALPVCAGIFQGRGLVPIKSERPVSAVFRPESDRGFSGSL